MRAVRLRGYTRKPNLSSSLAAGVKPAAPTFGHVREVLSYVARRHGLKATDLRTEPGKAFARHPHREAILDFVSLALARSFFKRDIAAALGASPHFVRIVETEWLA